MDDKRLKIELKTKTSVDISEQQAVIKFCVQAGTSPMRPRGSEVLSEMTHMCTSFFIKQRLTGLKMEEV